MIYGDDLSYPDHPFNKEMTDYFTKAKIYRSKPKVIIADQTIPQLGDIDPEHRKRNEKKLKGK